jgi:hypothetical protein
MSTEDSKVSDRASPPTLNDEQIITERRKTRRSFLAATGVALGGAVALAATGCTLNDPDKKKQPATAKPSDPDQKTPKTTKPSDPDQK